MAKVILRNLRGSAVFWLCLAVSITLIVAGFIVPPTGEINGSVLTAVGELFGFATLWCVYHAIDKGIDTRVTHGSTTIEVGDLDGKEVQ